MEVTVVFYTATELAAEETEAAEKAEASKDMDALWEAIKRLENENKELQKKLSEKEEE